MTNSTKSMLLVAAVSGLLGGATMTMQAQSPNGTAPASLVAGSPSFLGASNQDKPKHACKGQNACKGQGADGKNSCKGKGSCATDGSKPPMPKM